MWSSTLRLRRHSPIFVASLLQAVYDRLRGRGVLGGGIVHDYEVIVRALYEYSKRNPEVAKQIDFEVAGGVIRSGVVSWYYTQTFSVLKEPKEKFLIDRSLYRRFYEDLGDVLRSIKSIFGR